MVLLITKRSHKLDNLILISYLKRFPIKIVNNSHLALLFKLELLPNFFAGKMAIFLHKKTFAANYLIPITLLNWLQIFWIHLWYLFVPHDYLSKFPKPLTHKWFSKIISDHHQCRTILYLHFLVVYSIFDEKYLILICLEFPLHELCPFISIFITLWLSW